MECMLPVLGCVLPDLYAFVGKELAQFAGLIHFAYDIAAADKLALHVELRDRRPIRELFDAIADLGVLQHVDAFELHTH